MPTPTTRVQYAVAVIDALFGASIFILSEFYEQTGMPKKMANRLLWQLRKQEIITVFTEDGGRGDLCLPAPAHHH